MLADLDETLRALLRTELERHGFEGVDIAFDAPARGGGWPRVKRAGGVPGRPPPMVMECSYAVTAWTQAVEDEHRLLSQVLGVLFTYPQLPDDVLAGRLSQTAQRYAIEGRIGQPKSDGKADFWSAVGGQYKASLDYVITL